MSLHRLIALAFLALSLSAGAALAADPCATDAAPLLDTLFSSLGHDCDAYTALFAPDAKYYHQHDGYKTYAELPKNCQDYAAFCPGHDCKFQQNGQALKIARGDSCHILAPYIWSEMPANHQVPGNLEPHTGWEYIVAKPSQESRGGRGKGYQMSYIAEIEASYSVAFNWAKPDETPALFAESTLHLLSLKNSASRGECDAPLAPLLTRVFAARTAGGSVWRQQGDAVVLATGGVCHVAVPYSAQVGDRLKSGSLILTLQPATGSAYQIVDSVEFSRPSR